MYFREMLGSGVRRGVRVMRSADASSFMVEYGQVLYYLLFQTKFDASVL